MQPSKLLKPVSLTLPLSVTTLLLWKLKARCGMKWLWVESHFTTRLSRYTWKSNASLIYSMVISLFFIWMNLKICILVVQEHCFTNFSLKKLVSFLLISLMFKTFVLYQTSYKVFWKHTTYLSNKVRSTVEYWGIKRESFLMKLFVSIYYFF